VKKRLQSLLFQIQLVPLHAGADKTCSTCNEATLCDEVDQIIPKSLLDGYWIDPTDGNIVIQVGLVQVDSS
jgi:hypothetical protein